MNIPSDALLITHEITTSEMNIEIPMMLDRIYVQVKGCKPISSLFLPFRLGSIRFSHPFPTEQLYDRRLVL